MNRVKQIAKQNKTIKTFPNTIEISNQQNRTTTKTNKTNMQIQVFTRH